MVFETQSVRTFSDRALFEGEQFSFGRVYWDSLGLLCDVLVTSENKTRVLTFRRNQKTGRVTRVDDNGKIRPGLFAVIMKEAKSAFRNFVK